MRVDEHHIIGSRDPPGQLTALHRLIGGFKRTVGPKKMSEGRGKKERRGVEREEEKGEGGEKGEREGA